HTGKNDEASRIMQHVSDAYFHRRRRRRNLNLATTAALAAVAVIVIVLLLWTPGKPVNNDKLYARYYAPYHYVVNRASEGSLNLFAQAKVTYNQGHYKQSLAMSRELLGHDPDNAQYRFLLALSLNALGQTREAISQYRSLATDPGPANDRIHNLSSWYLGLCYIKSDNADSARFFLKQTEPLLGRYFLENMRPEEVLKKMGK
ncbi:MAG TPA: hypothetical protein VE870_01825, partial [Bacteroidales bacterium]|nr:hypothetical protein [Bacteroidales bacterium]